ncbi:MAG: DegT/DnrJ/EryC1/StrS family aminotransferase [Spirochaetaceae bacterium]|jgi:dTDP-4-amino-4,6-dideoxygalactose transaminase|nr:DegT/DnrJ/EryC1/StrS family aminotransferase [Spirochaetaceae bacterium]
MKIEVYSPTIKRKEMDAVLTTMVEDQVGPGEHTQFLIHTAKDTLKFDYCLALRSPVFALQLALETLLARKQAEGIEAVSPSAGGGDDSESVPRGKGVIISALSPFYYERVIRSLGLVPLYCDTAADSPLMAEDKITALMAAKPLCIVFRHTLGYLPEAESVSSLGLPVIEDCSQSAGTVLGGKQAGSFGTLAILGLEERDMITAGGGALLFAINRKDAALLRSLGELPPEYLLPDLNAAMAAVQFREEAKNLARRAELAGAYIQASMRTRHQRFRETEGLEYNNYSFSLILESGVKDVKSYAKRKDIEVEEAFDTTLAGSGAIPSAQCPCAYSLSLRTVLFPLYPRLGAQAAERVAKLIMTLP